MPSPLSELRAPDSPRAVDVRRDARIAAVVLGLLATFGLPLGLGETGPVALVPVLLAATWFGLRAARLAAGGASFLLVLAVLAGADVAPRALPLTVLMLFVTAEATGRLLRQLEMQSVELRRLRPVQDALAPATPPELPLLEIGVRYQPATSGVAGDFYLVAEGHNNSTVIAVGDVMGKGVKAAERSTFIRATLAAVSSSTEDPGHLLQAANAQLVKQYGISADFITMLCVVVRADTSLIWASAGHPPPVSLADGSAIGPLQPSFPLGIAPDLTGLQTIHSELPDAGILLYSDGLTDARPRHFEPFGVNRIGLILRELIDPSPQEAVDRLAAAAQAFARRPLTDDLCLVALRSKLARRPIASRALSDANGEPARVADKGDESDVAFEQAGAVTASRRAALPRERRQLIGAALVATACGAAALTIAAFDAGNSAKTSRIRTAVTASRPRTSARPLAPTPAASRPVHHSPVTRFVRLRRLANAPSRARGTAKLTANKLDITVRGLGRPARRRGTVWLYKSPGGAVPVATFRGGAASLDISLPRNAATYRLLQVAVRPAPGELEKKVLSAPLPALTSPTSR